MVQQPSRQSLQTSSLLCLHSISDFGLTFWSPSTTGCGCQSCLTAIGHQRKPHNSASHSMSSYVKNVRSPQFNLTLKLVFIAYPKLTASCQWMLLAHKSIHTATVKNKKKMLKLQVCLANEWNVFAHI